MRAFAGAAFKSGTAHAIDDYGGVAMWLHHALRRCDGDGAPAHLEATTLRNKALYERHGLEELGVIQVGESPPMWPMLRTAR